MNISRRFLNILAALVMGMSAASAVAQEGLSPNGNYSLIGLSLSRIHYANEKCYYSECRQGYGGLGVNLSYQLIPNMIIGFDNMRWQSSMTTTTIKESQGGLFVGFVMGVGSTLDIGGVISPVRKKTDSCLGNICTNYEDTGTNVGFFGKWWLNDDKTFNVGLNLDSYFYSSSNTNSNNETKYSSSALSVSYTLADHHEFSLTGARLKETSGVRPTR